MYMLLGALKHKWRCAAEPEFPLCWGLTRQAAQHHTAVCYHLPVGWGGESGGKKSKSLCVEIKIG